MSRAPGLRLRKHHGLGNDFLVLADFDGVHPIDADLARAVCERHTGIGADGLIRLTAPVGGDPEGAVAVMELLNADGSPAETSGNGLRCVGQALVQTGVAPGPDLVVTTAAGPRRLTVGPTDATGVASVSVGMGRAVAGGEVPGEDPARRARRVDIGNPHLVVLVDDPWAVDVGVEGPALQHRFPAGVNVTFAAVVGPDEVSVRTWERGAGMTEACGSGCSATAVALSAWGLVGTRVTLHNPGGDVRVDLGGDEVVLTGPVQFVGTVELA